MEERSEAEIKYEAALIQDLERNEDIQGEYRLMELSASPISRQWRHGILGRYIAKQLISRPDYKILYICTYPGDGSRFLFNIQGGNNFKNIPKSQFIKLKSYFMMLVNNASITVCSKENYRHEQSDEHYDLVISGSSAASIIKYILDKPSCDRLLILA